MQSRYGRLDRFLSKQLRRSVRELKPVLAAGRVTVDGQPVRRADYQVGPFEDICLDGEPLQIGCPRLYLMLNKPAGVVSATRDARHATVMDLVREQLGASQTDSLHMAGRLDATSTGLMLLTNDGKWSRALSHPDNGVSKTYRITVAQPLTDGDAQAFAQGMYFATENLTTRPAQLQRLGEREARVILQEGRYHQIRRMIARCNNRVLTLHREAIGPWRLPDALAPGQCCPLSNPDALSGHWADRR